MRRLTTILMVISLTMAMPLAAGAWQSETDQADSVPIDQAPTDQAPDLQTDRHGFQTAKERALAAIDRRLDALSRSKAAVESSEHVDANHQAQLLAELAQHERELARLRDDIASTESLGELVELAPLIVTEHWIFAMVIPKATLVVGADTVGAAVEGGEEIAAAIQTAIDRLEESGIDLAAAQAELNAATNALASAETLASGIPEAVLGISPSEMPGAGTVLQAAHADLRASADALRSARDHGRAAIELIRQAVDRG